MEAQAQQTLNAPFTLKFIKPYETFSGGVPKPIPYVIDGLLTQGGFSLLAGKPKLGKSSFARYEAVRITKGLPVLGRGTTRGDAILISLEDPINHVDNCLSALGWDPLNDGNLEIIDKLSSKIDQSIDAIGDALTKMPNVRIVIIDTLAKLLRVKDFNEYMPVMNGVEKLHDLARQFPNVHIQGLVHCKKVKMDDPFDSLLGSTALRGEADTNIALYSDKGQRVITTETRIGRNIQPTIFEARLTEIGGADVVADYNLGQPFSLWETSREMRIQKAAKLSPQERIIAHLEGSSMQSDTQEHTLKSVTGNRKAKFDAIQELISSGVLTVTGEKQSSSNPTKLHLNPERVEMHRFISKHGQVDETPPLMQQGN